MNPILKMYSNKKSQQTFYKCRYFLSNT